MSYIKYFYNWIRRYGLTFSPKIVDPEWSAMLVRLGQNPIIEKFMLPNEFYTNKLYEEYFVNAAKERKILGSKPKTKAYNAFHKKFGSIEDYNNAKKAKNTLKQYIAYILSYLPTPLPVGLVEFETWSDSIIALSGNYADLDSMKFAIASILIHADSKYGRLPKAYFVNRLRKSAANQIASQIFQDIKTRQQAALDAAKAAATVKEMAVDGVEQTKN